MPGWSFPINGAVVAGCVAFDDSANSIWLANDAGEIHSLRLMDTLGRLAGSGYRSPIGLILNSDGLGLTVVEASGLVWQTAREGADRAQASQVADAAEPVVAAALHPDGRIVILTAAGAVRALDQVAGTVEQLGDGFSQPLALSIDAGAQLAVVLEAGVADRGLRVLELETGVVRPSIAIGGETSAILATEQLNGAPAVLCCGAAGQLSLVDLGGAVTEAGPALAAAAVGLCRWGRLVLAATETTVEAVEWGLEAGSLPISMPIRPLFVSGYTRVDVDLASKGLTRADIRFALEEGAEGGFVSAGIEPDSDAGLTRVVVCAGMEPGEYHLVANKVSDSSFLGRARYRVTAHWPDEEVGPPVSITGKHPVFVHGSWGGGPAGPQNVNVLAAPDTWRVLLVLVDTKDGRFSAGDVAGMKTRWTTNLIGPGNCVKTFYEENSLFNTAGGVRPRGTTITLANNDVLGPVHLDLGWGDCFEPNKMSDVWSGWNPKSTFWQDCATALCDVLADNGTGDAVLRSCDAVVFIVHTASAGLVKIGDKDYPAEFVWPQADGATFWSKTQFATSFIDKPVVLINDDQPSGGPANMLPGMEVLCHELGHTLGLEDLYQRGDYPAEVDARAIDDLDYMGSEFTLPQASLANKMRLGWIDPVWIDSFDFGKNPAGRDVVLQAVESMARSGPPSGRKAGIEVRIQDGWNYYFEYRRTLASEMTDQKLATSAGGAQVVLGTDVRPDGSAKPARPVILRLGVDADGNGPLLKANGEDYEETDTTNPNRDHDFRLVFDQFDPVDPNAVHVKVEYIAAHRPQLQIMPAPGRGDWKSPDIDLTGPGGANKIQKGRRHTVIVRVHNQGSLAAQNVRVGLAWLPFTTSAGAWVNLPDPPRQDVPALGAVTFTQDWDVPAEMKVDDIEVEHFCVKASIDAFVDPRDPSHNEIVVFDNWAQSNFDTTTISDGSPSERHWTGLTVTNTLPQRATFLTVAEQDNDFFRVYVGNAWLRLPPGQTRMIEAGYESLAGDEVRGGDFERAFADGMEAPNRASFNSFVVRDDPSHCSSKEVVWGAGLALRVGRRTSVDDWHMQGEVLRGHVLGHRDGMPQPMTSGQVNIVFWTEDRPGDELMASANMDATGRFTVLVPGPIMQRVGQAPISAEVFYLGTPIWAPCRSGERRVG